MTYLAALTGGALYALGNIGFGFWPLAFICLLPLWWGLEQIQNSRHYRQALALGSSFGLGIFFTGYQWLLSLAGDFVSGNPIVSYALWGLSALWFASGFAAYAAVHVWARRRKTPFVLAASLPLLLLEWWQLNLFPTYLGSGLVHQGYLAQLASLGGPLLLSALVIVVNALIYQSLKGTASQSDRLRPLLTAVCLIAFGFTYGALQRHLPEPGEQKENFRVATIQSNLVKLEQAELSQRSHRIHLEMSRELLKSEALGGQSPDLIIWPETAYARSLRRPLPLDAQFIRADIEVPLLFGASSSWQKDGKRASANSLFLADANGRIEQAYDKNLLVPFAETIPFQENFAWLKSHSWIAEIATKLEQLYLDNFNQIFPQHQSFSQGFSHGPIKVGSLKLSTPICFELVNPEHMRKMLIQHQSNMIVTIANDAWFGDSQEPWIHLALARQRAIEHGRWVVRATNSGISAIIDPYGQITRKTGLHTRETLIGDAQTRHDTTLYTQYGDWPGYLSLIIMLGLLLKHRFRKPSTNKNRQIRPSN